MSQQALANLNLTIDSIYKNLLEKLTNDHKIKDVSKKVISIPDNDKRVLYAYELIKTYNLLPTVLKVDKDEYVSTHYRNLGNQFYQRSDLYAAWQYYNLALLYSPLSAMTYSLAFANRSAIFAALKKYKACLEDIKMVFKLKYPDKIRDKLIRRQKLCEDALKDPEIDAYNDSVKEMLTFKGTRHETYVAASSKLEVKYTPEMGRHVVAMEDIDVGEIIVQEDPYVQVLLKSQFIFACEYCFSRKPNLYPCSFCCATMYCSKQCVKKAWDEYHSYECPLKASLIKLDFTKLELIALRTTIKSRSEHEDWNQILEVATNAEATIGTEYWGCDVEDDKLIYDSKFYPAIHTLATNIEKRDISDIFQKCVSAATLIYLLAVAKFIEMDDKKLKVRIRSYTAKNLLLHLMTAPTNMHSIATNVENEEGNYVEECNIGCGAYAFLSLINHSCAPNVVRYNQLGTSQITMIALRPIKKGQQLFDNYGAHHAVHTKEERQSILKFQYKFTCLCEACLDNWPVFQDLKVVKLPPAIARKRNKYLSGQMIEALQKGDKEHALKLFKPLCELTAALDPYIPCKQAAECQESLKQCFDILLGVLPNGFSRFIDWEMPPPHIDGQPVVSRFYTDHGAQDLE